MKCRGALTLHTLAGRDFLVEMRILDFRPGQIQVDHLRKQDQDVMIFFFFFCKIRKEFEKKDLQQSKKKRCRSMLIGH